MFSHFFPWCTSPQWAGASSLPRLQDHTHTHTTFGKTPLDEWSARRRDLYLTTYITHKREISITPVEFEPAIPASERPQNYALIRTATRIGFIFIYREKVGLCLEQKGASPVYRPQESLWFSYEEVMPHIISELDTTTKVGVVMQSVINYLSINSLAPFHILGDLQWTTHFTASVSHLCFTVSHKNLQGNQDGLTTMTHRLPVRINNINVQRGKTKVLINAWAISLHWLGVRSRNKHTFRSHHQHEGKIGELNGSNVQQIAYVLERLSEWRSRIRLNKITFGGKKSYHEVQNLSSSRLLYKQSNLNIRPGQSVNLRIGS
jgi:hypothetical protein